MSGSPFDLIHDACSKARAAGIEIVRGPHFDWTGADPKVPRGCNALGAILWANGLARGWADLCRILDEGTFWLYRFTLGWDRNMVLAVLDPESMKEFRKDDVSLRASRMAKEWVA